jgi:C4-dicarboxylate-specific signal transduction histidine kinase
MRRKNNRKISDKGKDENLLFLLELCEESTKCIDCGVFLLNPEDHSFQPLLTHKNSKRFLADIKSYWKKKSILRELKKPGLIGENETVFIAPLFSEDELTGFFAAYLSAPPKLLEERKYKKLILFSQQIQAYLENSKLKEWMKTKEERINSWQKEFPLMRRMASVGQLTRDFAHDINNPLQIILGKAQILTMRLEKEGVDKKYLEELKAVEKNAQRISCLLKKLSDFARRSEKDLSSSSDVNLNHLIEQTFLLVKNRFRSKGIEFKVNADSKIPSVKGNPHQLEQVLLDLFLNAQRSMPQGGMLMVNLKKEKDFLKLDFTDTGENIPKELLPKVFEPRLFDSDLKKRLHPGLLLSNQIVRDHKGEMEIHSDKNRGNIFRLKLPILP